jgi:hypothetical protein
MVYQGHLHSLDKTRVKHTSNFMDPVSIDTVLVEAVTLNKSTKYVPQNKIKLATRRLAAAKTFQDTAEE